MDVAVVVVVVVVVVTAPSVKNTGTKFHYLHAVTDDTEVVYIREKIILSHVTKTVSVSYLIISYISSNYFFLLL